MDFLEILISYFYFFSWELYVQIHGKFLIKAFAFLVLSLSLSFFLVLYIVWLLTRCQMLKLAKILSHSVWSFRQLLAVQKPFNFMRSHLLTLGHPSWANGSLLRKSFLHLYLVGCCLRCLLAVSGFPISRWGLWFIWTWFLCRVIDLVEFPSLSVDTQFYQHHLLKVLPFL